MKDLWIYPKNGGIRGFHAMDFGLHETRIIDELLQLLRRIGCHTINDFQPLGIHCDDLYHDDKLATGFYHPAHLIDTFRQLRPEIDGLNGSHEIELCILIRQLAGRASRALATLSSEMSMP